MKRIPRHEQVMLVFVVFVLTLGPALSSASRAPTFDVHVSLAPVPNAPQAPGSVLSYVRRMAAHGVKDYVGNVTFVGGTDPSFVRSITVNTAGTAQIGAVTISGKTRSPGRAINLLRLIAGNVAALSHQNSAFWFRATTELLPGLRRALSTHISPAGRRLVLAKERFITAALGAEPPAGPLRVQNAGVVSRQGLWDRIIAQLPGEPAPGDPIWAAVAGFALAMALCFAWIYLVGGGGSRRAAAISS